MENNQLTHLPEEIKNLTKLVHLSINGNKIPLPDTYSPTDPKKTIEFILERQNEPVPKDSPIITKAYFFTNASKETVINRYQSLLKSFSETQSIEFIPLVTAKSINAETNLVFIIIPIDSHDNEKLAKEVARNCKKMGVRFFILTQDEFIETGFDSANLSKWDIFQKTKIDLQENFPNECKKYSSYEQFNNLILEALKQHKPNIRLIKLTLENIGHFSNLEISFDKDISCLIGENGTGKSTILKALALAITGPNHKKLDEKSKRSFLKIQDFSEGNIKYQNGLIKLDYSIDGDLFSNELNILPDDNGNDINIIATNESHIIYSKYYLKSLIIGFPQARGNESLEDSGFIQNKIIQPHVSDLIPLINNSDDYRLRSFSGWIANLYFDSIKEKKEGNNSEELLIKNVFEIISRITKKNIIFKTVTKIDPPDVWVITSDSPNGIPLYLVSQGFKIVIGWIGYLMQRFVNTFPLSDPQIAFKENAIVIIDEVDISMHPKWQWSFIEILRETFSNTQFIFTTHDPLIIGSLLKEQVRVFTESNGIIEATQPETDPKGLGVAGILTSELFGLSSTLDEKTLKVLDRRNELISKQDNTELSTEEKIELNEIFQNLNSLGINTTDRDPLYQKFIVAISERDEFKKENYTAEDLKAQNDIALDTLNDLLKEQGEKK
ncbi:MAG: AAA family ATPase [Saprospiraceae bacterium]|nr:AAA family ATPase [Saprospiraceae bacterium]